MRNGLLVTEVALSIVLLVGAALLLRSFARVTTVDPGFRAGQRPGVPGRAADRRPIAEDHQRVAFFDKLLEPSRRSFRTFAAAGMIAGAADARQTTYL